ncbi:MAG TPA: hypothetical protein VMO26_10715 [Vicinamibacterales bacterium]|nr:hypothetical protein [Vicinamibacterales bacterium]
MGRTQMACGRIADAKVMLRCETRAEQTLGSVRAARATRVADFGAFVEPA